MSRKFLHPLNAEEPIDVTSQAETSFRALQPSKVDNSIRVTLLGNRTLVREEQFINAEYPITETLSGIVILDNEEQL
jgi:hypothetical protein